MKRILRVGTLLLLGLLIIEYPSVYAGLGVGDPAADFNLLSQFNTYYRLFDYENYVIIVDFSIMNCLNCKLEAVALENEVWLPYHDRNVMVFGLLSENESGRTPGLEDLNSWADTWQLTYPILQELGSTLSEYGVTVYPTTFIIGRDMQIRYVSTSYDHDQLMAAFMATLNEDTPTPVDTAPPTPTCGQTATPPPVTPTPTPTPDENDSLAIGFWLSDNDFQEGDQFQLIAEFQNDGSSVVGDFYAMLDVFGYYYFYPQWTEQLMSQTMTIDSGASQVTVLGPFTWPYVEGELNDLFFYGVVTLPDTYETISNVAFVEFGYGP